MEHQEKKYRVDTFDSVKKKLKQVNTSNIREVISTHYYGEHKGNNVEKFVEYPNRVEIHILKESDGKFTLIKRREIKDKNIGFTWFKARGYKTINIVKIVSTIYKYKDGTVGLYIIDDFLHSVILYYPPDQHAIVEKEFGLDKTEVISVPYNKFLYRIGRLRSMRL